MADRRESAMAKRIYRSVMRASAAGRPEEVLEVDPGASPKEVQTAWRDLSLALHPDKVRGALTADEATEAMKACLLYTSPSPRDQRGSRMPSSA